METTPKIRLLYHALVELWRDRSGQDMIEYAMMAAMVAVAVAACVPYTLIPSVSHVYSRLQNVISVLVPN